MAKLTAKIAVGAVFGVPLKDGSRAVGQVIELIHALRAALCVFYSYKVNEAEQVQSLSFEHDDVVAVQPVSIRPLQKGEWEIMGDYPVANADLTRVLNGLREARFVGLSVPNSNTVEALMNAHHGQAAWEIGSDTDFLRRLLYRQT